MPHNYAIRISRSYDEVSRLVGYIAQHADQVAVVEHLKDADVSRTHVHMAVYGCYITVDAIKKHAANVLGMKDLKGQGDWSFKESYKQDKEVIAMTLENRERYLTYMSKGKYDAKYLKEISQQQFNDAKAKWVQYETRSRKSRDVVMYEEFARSMSNERLLEYDAVHPEFIGWKRLKQDAVAFSFGKHAVWNVQAAKDAKMLAITFAMYRGITMDVNNEMKMF